MIKSVYRHLTGAETCKGIGSHWTEIGFQGTDPSTDLRGAGMLGVLHLLYFVTAYSETAKLCLRHSQSRRYEFPMAVTMLEFTIITLGLMRSGKLYDSCNRVQSVLFPTAMTVV